MIFRNQERQHLFLPASPTRAVENFAKSAKKCALNLRGIEPLKKSAPFSAFLHYAVFGMIRCVPNRPFCIL